MQAKSKPMVVFANVPPGSSSEFALEFKDDDEYDMEQPCWSIEFKQTKLPPGMHMFYFTVDGTRTLSSTYPIIGDMNAAIFSDSFRRYILGHGKTRQTSNGSNRSNGRQTSPAAPANPGDPPRSPADTSMPKRMSSLVINAPKESGTGMKRRVASFSQGLSDLHNSPSRQELDQLQANQRSSDEVRRTPTALFSQSVFVDLYDNELPLRLHPSVLHGLDWGAKNLGGSLQLWSGSARVGKQHGHCEDACFVSTSAVGVADGVGGMSAFSSFGVDSAKMAAELMEGAQYACEEIRDEHPDMIAQDCALEAMRLAEDRAQSFGASTMTVAVVKQSELGVANLGDSGFMILRRGKQRLEIVARSTEQHHRWNCPFQLTRLPPALSKKFPGFACDTPNDSDKYTIPIQEGDLLLVFTDGLRDNLHDKEIRHVTECALPPGVSYLVGLPEYKTAPESIAKALVLAAFERSRDPKAMVPFAKGCRKNGYEYEGGKEDDITVVAAWVVQDSEISSAGASPETTFISFCGTPSETNVENPPDGTPSQKSGRTRSQ